MISVDTQSRSGKRRLLALLVVVSALVVAGCSTELPQNSLNPAGPEAHKIDGLFWLVFWIAAGIFVLVEGALIFTTLRFRRRRNESREVEQVHGNVRLEMLWTMIPVVILAAIAVPTVSTIFDLRRAPDPGENALVVNVIGHQWWWEFEYPEYGFETANEMHIPVGRTVYLNITSADVIHSFWVPQLNGKRDAVPSRLNHLTITADEVGLYRGQCAEFCGLSHADMRHRIYAESEADFAVWVADQQKPAEIPTEGPAAAGWETFQIICAACHNAGGTGTPVSRPIVASEAGEEFTFDAALAPDLTHFGSRTTFAGATQDRTDEHLRAWLANPSDLKPMRPDLNDLASGRILGMPDFGLTEEQIDGLIALLEGWK